MIQAAALLLICSLAFGGECFPVTGAHIRAGEIARLDSAFASLPPDDPILLAPRAGVERQLTAGDLRKLAVRKGIQSQTESGGCFAWPMMPLDPLSVHAAVKDVLPGNTIEVLETSDMKRPPGEIVFDRRGLSAIDSASGVFLWRGSVQYTEQQSYPVWARVKLSAHAACVIATKSIPVGTVLTGDHVRSMESDVPSRVALECVTAQAATDKRTKRSLRTGQVIRTADVEPVPAIAPGDEVAVDVYSGRAHLSFMAKAESPASTGDRIFLRNPRSGKRFPARVSGPGKAEVVSEGVRQ